MFRKISKTNNSGAVGNYGSAGRKCFCKRKVEQGFLIFPKAAQYDMLLVYFRVDEVKNSKNHMLKMKLRMKCSKGEYIHTHPP